MTIYEPFIPSRGEMITLKLELAELQPGEVVFDLGCGDDRVLIQAARDYQVTCVGYELRPDLAATALGLVRQYGLEDRITIRRQNLMQAELASADVLILYLSQEVMAQLSSKLRSELRPGVRIVSHTFGLPGWSPARHLRVRTGNRQVDEVFLYRV
jgi:cyclopropane fatty-acyl-phospholipid synthase-like methyltransferase